MACQCPNRLYWHLPDAVRVLRRFISLAALRPFTAQAVQALAALQEPFPMLHIDEEGTYAVAPVSAPSPQHPGSP